MKKLVIDGIELTIENTLELLSFFQFALDLENCTIKEVLEITQKYINENNIHIKWAHNENIESNCPMYKIGTYNSYNKGEFISLYRWSGTILGKVV